MILIFDLDDTLYDELSFVKSGFRAVATFLHKERDVNPDDMFRVMCQELEVGRSNIFDRALKRCILSSKQLVQECVAVYRGHKPTIYLYPMADQCLKRFEDLPIYIVTDGNKHVQWNKVVALGLLDRVKFPFITRRYGIKNEKPSPYCFQKICERERVKPADLTYVGDNPRKDFVGIKPLGVRTIRVKTGQHRDLQMPKEYEASVVINDLSSLTHETLFQLTR